jgi:hypothetical protein
MTEHEVESEQGLIYQDLLPLAWRTAERSPSPLEAIKLNGNNEELLRFIDILDDRPNDTNNLEYPQLNQELAKIEVKFELMLSLMSQLLNVYFPLPPPVQVRLSTTGAQWISQDILETGGYGFMDVYLNLRCPRPLIFTGKIAHVEETTGGYRINVQFDELSAAIRERLEKIIFRHHRRSVAQVRRRLVPEPGAPPA